MAYEYFYQFYDELMEDIPYEAYIDLVKSFSKPGQKLLDLGCGTGKVLIPLVEAGFFVDGLDASETMLLRLQDKLLEKGLHSNLYEDDMQNLNRPNSYDVVFSLIDTMNYLKDASALEQAIKGVYTSLVDGGVFLFDIHNKAYIEDVFDDYSHHEVHESYTYLWDTFLEKDENSTEILHQLTFFIEDSSGSYERRDEEHLQKVFELPFYIQLLEETGFKSIQVQSDFEEGIDIRAAKYQLICIK